MAGNSTAKIQHYVPQFLLRNFGVGKKRQLNVFEKATGKTFVTNARNIAGESRFYDFEVEGKRYTIEPSLAQIESKAKPLLQRIIDKDSLATLEPKERAVLSIFFSIQFTRTRAFKEQWQSLPQMLAEKMQARLSGTEAAEGLEDYFRVPDENETTVQMIKFMEKVAGSHSSDDTQAQNLHR